MAVAFLAAGCGMQTPAELVFGTPVPLAVPPAPAAAAPAPVPADGTVAVAAGDTVYAIARRYGVSIRALIDANGLEPPYTLRIGQRLALPATRDHVVVGGETLFGIARRYGVDMAVLARLNGLAEPYAVTAGQRLQLPEAAAAPETAASVAAAAEPSGAPPPPPPKPSILTASTTPAIPAAGTLPPPPPRSKNTFLWPVEGKVVAGFGPRPGGKHNDGINIVAPRGTAVRAAENGVVAYIGNELRGYGNLILIRHADGWVTAYAHNEVVLVVRGDTVRRGDIIGRVGSSGNVATPQTHFELRHGVRSVDPIKHLVWN